MWHDHAHSHGSDDANTRRLGLTLSLVVVYMGVEILAAFVNGATLVAVAIYIFVEAFARFKAPLPR
jgi:Co/Zn/Cd efflux system component